jgi:hypothetical protein
LKTYFNHSYIAKEPHGEKSKTKETCADKIKVCFGFEEHRLQETAMNIKVITDLYTQRAKKRFFIMMMLGLAFNK